MYYPYLRGKRNELLVLREVSKLLSQNGNIVPIIEPVKKNTKDLVRASNELVDYGIPFVLITNPYVGELADFPSDFIRSFINENIPLESNLGIMGYIVSDRSSIQSIENFLSDYQGRPIALIHAQSYRPIKDIINLPGIDYQIFIDGRTSNDYQSAFSEYEKILIRDGFTQRRNADYPDEEFFSDLHKTYEELGFDGFGDFLIVGDRFIRDGGPAHAVAIHLTYQFENNDIYVKHFVSDRVTGPKDPGGKFLEALTKLVAYLGITPEILEYSTACQEYIELFGEKHYPGLGFVKKLSMRHHIELLNTIV